MTIGLLAAIPACHVESAQERCAVRGKAAFGTSKPHAFEHIEKNYPHLMWDLPVLIHVSDGDLQDRAMATLSARLCGLQPANGQGQHPDPTCRPATTLELDEPLHGGRYWEIKNLNALDSKVPFSELTKLSNGIPVSPKLHVRFPILVEAPFEKWIDVDDA